MLHLLYALCLFAIVVLPASFAYGQLPAFPGAEGVARYVTGGRGGDVYVVSNLNDTGPGSLRHGISTAPSSGRTIVFGVGGTITLNSSLDFNGKSNITIAGQTAPGGGITLANHRVRINDADNVIMQFVRVRPGSTNGSQDPDAIWVQTSTNVMLDHITASWAVDETISTTHNSNNVTVQWSTITQGLYEGGHSKGDGHSYGSLINGGAYSYHHNLYAHSKSRHPRAQASGNYLRLDFVNNVMFNPQDRFGYSDSNDPFDVNLVGNYGIKGPQSSSNNALFVPDDDASRFYVEGNFTDINRDGLINGSAVNGSQVFRDGTAYTLSPTRLSSAQLPPVTTHTAQRAYVEVLSRAGAVNYRDPVDRRLIRSVLNQLNGSIATEADWGGLPPLAAGTAPTDSNSDGVPDDYAMAIGFDVLTPLHTQFAPSGYTYLEEYLHSLTPFAYAPVDVEPLSISTGFGRGGDAQVSELGGLAATSSGNGTDSSIDVRWDGASGSTNHSALLKFDLSPIVPGSVASAALQLTLDQPSSGSQTFRLFAAEPDDAGWDWDEASVEYDGAPGLAFDGNSRTLGYDPESVLLLGTATLGGSLAGDTLTFDNLNLAVLLNLAAQFENEPQAGLVSLVLEQTSAGSGVSFYSSEGSAEFAPQLLLEATVAIVEPILPGDYNSDGVVNLADYVQWRDTLGETGLDAFAGADGDGDGSITIADYGVWTANFGNTLPAQNLRSATAAAVPEPASYLLLIVGVSGWGAVRGRARLTV